MARRIQVSDLENQVSKILAEYGNAVKENFDDIMKDIGKEGVKILKSESRSKFKARSGDYAKGWTYKGETGRLSSQGYIYNADVPGLPHLLEHGHANRNGGRTPGRVHIKPVEEALIKEFEQKVKAKL